MLPAPKGGRPIRQVLSGAARVLLKATRHVAGSPYVFPKISDVEKPFGKDAIESAWQHIRVFAGLADVHLHDLRHAVGTYAGETGANAFMVRNLLAHRTLAMTGRYVNRDAAPLRALADEVSERIAARLR